MENQDHFWEDAKVQIKNESRFYFSQRDIAEIFSITISAASKIISKNGILPKIDPGSGREKKYDAREFGKYFRKPAKLSDDLRQQLIRKAKWEADKKRLEVMEQDGRLIDAVEAEKSWTDFMIEIRNKFLALPNRLIATCNIKTEDIDKIKELISDALNDLSKTEDKAGAEATKGS